MPTSFFRRKRSTRDSASSNSIDNFNKVFDLIEQEFQRIQREATLKRKNVYVYPSLHIEPDSPREGCDLSNVSTFISSIIKLLKKDSKDALNCIEELIISETKTPKRYWELMRPLTPVRQTYEEIYKVLDKTCRDINATCTERQLESITLLATALYYAGVYAPKEAESNYRSLVAEDDKGKITITRFSSKSNHKIYKK